MTDYEVIVVTDYGKVRLVIEAENYNAANVFANQMNQGNVWVNEIEENEHE